MERAELKTCLEGFILYLFIYLVVSGILHQLVTTFQNKKGQNTGNYFFNDFLKTISQIKKERKKKVTFEVGAEPKKIQIVFNKK